MNQYFFHVYPLGGGQRITGFRQDLPHFLQIFIYISVFYGGFKYIPQEIGQIVICVSRIGERLVIVALAFVDRLAHVVGCVGYIIDIIEPERHHSGGSVIIIKIRVDIENIIMADIRQKLAVRFDARRIVGKREQGIHAFIDFFDRRPAKSTNRYHVITVIMPRLNA